MDIIIEKIKATKDGECSSHEFIKKFTQQNQKRHIDVLDRN